MERKRLSSAGMQIQTSGTRRNQAGSRSSGRKRSGKNVSWLGRQLRKRPRPVWLLIAMDFIALVAALLVFAYFHHVKPRADVAVGLTSNREAAGAAAAVETESAQTTDVMQQNLQAVIAQIQADTQPGAGASNEAVGYFGSKFADKFTDGEVIAEGHNYRSANLNIAVREEREYASNIFISDIYVKDIECLCTGFAKDQFGRNITEKLADTASRSGSIVCVNGDYYGVRKDGAVIRNGVLYRDDDYTESDVCILYWDGSMKTYPAGKFDAEAEMAAGAYQCWSFGPMLVDEDGEPLTEFNAIDNILGEHPRTAIGYFEPGHYCFVVIDGRSAQSEGVTMSKLARYMYLLGCKQAYNLDGGQTSQMLWGTETINVPDHNGRACSDIIYVRDM